MTEVVRSKHNSLLFSKLVPLKNNFQTNADGGGESSSELHTEIDSGNQSLINVRDLDAPAASQKKNTYP